MIEGVEVLSTYETCIFDFNLLSAFYGFAIVGFIGSIIYAANLDKINNATEHIYMLGSIILASLLVGVIVGRYVFPSKTMIQEYKVTASDDVSLNEFIEKYEIIDIEGKIYTIREKDKE